MGCCSKKSVPATHPPMCESEPPHVITASGILFTVDHSVLIETCCMVITLHRRASHYYCLLTSASYCVLPTVSLPTASYCLLASCLLPPTASFLLPTAGAMLLCRGCEPGEQYDNNVCRECQEQTYSFHPGDNGGQCQTCPDTAHCPGGPIFVPDDYYWHSAFDSDTAQRCPNTFACRLVSAVMSLCSTLTELSRWQPPC